MVPNRLGQRRVAGLAGASLTAALLTCGYSSVYAASPAAEQAVEIIHQPLDCWPSGEHVVLSLDVRPSGDVQKTLAYIRWDRSATWYFVPMLLNAQGAWVAVMPKTLPDTTGLVYFFESMSSSYMSTRSSEFRVPVRSQCPNAAAVIYQGSTPNITLGSTGGAPLAPGFQASGVTTFINPSGLTTATAGGGGGGISGRTMALIGGGAGAAAVFAFAGNSSGDATSTTDGGGGITTTAGTTTSITGGGPGSTTTTASGGRPSSTTTAGGGGNTSTIIGGGSTSTVSGGSTTTVIGSSTSTIGGSSTTTSAGSSTTSSVSSTSSSSSSVSTTTVASTSTTTAPGGTANVTVTITDSPGSIAVGSEVVYTITIHNGGPGDALLFDVRGTLTNLEGRGGGGGCGSSGSSATCAVGSLGPGGTFVGTVRARGLSVGTGTLTLTVRWTDTARRTKVESESTNITSTLRVERDDTAIAFGSDLRVVPRDGRIRAQILVNEVSLVSDNAGPHVHNVNAIAGKNSVETTVELSNLEGAWRFDFSATKGFVAGSLRVQSGQVQIMDGNSVHFALRPGSNTLRFSFVLQD